jgi:hypothetical protein
MSQIKPPSATFHAKIVYSPLDINNLNDVPSTDQVTTDLLAGLATDPNAQNLPVPEVTVTQEE